MPNPTTSAIAPSVFDWRETEVENLREGSRFRLIGGDPEDDSLFVVLHVRNNCFFQVFETEWIDNKTIETSFRELSLKASDFVLVTAFHEQAIVNEGTQ